MTKAVPLLKVPPLDRSPTYNNDGPGGLLDKGTRLDDLRADPGQLNPLDDPRLERRTIGLMTGLMRDTDAPPEAFARLDLAPGSA